MFAQKIITWYKKNKRDLPWRNTKDAYKIWISEIILQQTRVAQGMPYYENFLTTYPTLQHLANADENEVLRLWQGLGYYSRARNLLFTAKYLHLNLKGVFPESHKELIKLKGIGNYTAAAIASFAFGKKTPTIDGNVMRVMARYLNYNLAINQHGAFEYFWEFLMPHIQDVNSSDFNQGLMEIGSLICNPRNPNCLACPLNYGCFAFQNKNQEQYPIKIKKAKSNDRLLNYLVFFVNGKIGLNKRGNNDIWKNLYDFFETNDYEETLKSLKVNPEKMQLYTPQRVLHKLTHLNLEIVFYLVKINETQDLNLENLEFYTLIECEKLPKPIVIANFIESNITFFQ